MKKTIKEIRAEELAAKIAEEAKANRQAELDAIEEKDAFSTIPEVREGQTASVSDENNRLLGVEGGGKYHTTLVNGEIITAETKEALEAIKARMENGIKGDGMLHKTVYILGMKCDIHGRNQEELDEDYRKAEEFAYAHKGHMFRDVPEAEALHESGYTENDGEQVKIRCRTCLILFDEARVINMGTHETLLDLTDADQLGADAAKLSRENIKKLIVEKLEKRFLEEDLAAAQEYNDDNDDDDDDYDDEVDVEHCREILNEWIAYGDIEDMKEALYDLYDNGDITEEEYDYIVNNWDDLLD